MAFFDTAYRPTDKSAFNAYIKSQQNIANSLKGFTDDIVASRKLQREEDQKKANAFAVKQALDPNYAMNQVAANDPYSKYTMDALNATENMDSGTMLDEANKRALIESKREGSDNNSIMSAWNGDGTVVDKVNHISSMWDTANTNSSNALAGADANTLLKVSQLKQSNARYKQQQDWQNMQWQHKLDREAKQDVKDQAIINKQTNSAQLLQNIAKGRTADNVSTYSDGNKYILSDADMNKQLSMSDLYDKKYADGKVNDGFINQLQGMVPQVQGHQYSKYDQANVLRSQIAGLDPTKYDINSLNNAAANLEKVADSSTDTAELDYRDRALAEKERGKLAVDIATKGVKGTDQYKATAKNYDDQLSYIAKQIAKTNRDKDKPSAGGNSYLSAIMDYESKIRSWGLGSSDTKDAIEMFERSLENNTDPKLAFKQLEANKLTGKNSIKPNIFVDKKIDEESLVKSKAFLKKLAQNKKTKSNKLQEQYDKVLADKTKTLAELPEQIKGRAMTRDEKFKQLFEEAKGMQPKANNSYGDNNIVPISKDGLIGQQKSSVDSSGNIKLTNPYDLANPIAKLKADNYAKLTEPQYKAPHVENLAGSNASSIGPKVINDIKSEFEPDDKLLVKEKNNIKTLEATPTEQFMSKEDKSKYNTTYNQLTKHKILEKAKRKKRVELERAKKKLKYTETKDKQRFERENIKFKKEQELADLLDKTSSILTKEELGALTNDNTASNYSEYMPIEDKIKFLKKKASIIDAKQLAKSIGDPYDKDPNAFSESKLGKLLFGEDKKVNDYTDAQRQQIKRLREFVIKSSFKGNKENKFIPKYDSRFSDVNGSLAQQLYDGTPLNTQDVTPQRLKQIREFYLKTLPKGSEYPIKLQEPTHLTPDQIKQQRKMWLMSQGFQ